MKKIGDASFFRIVDHLLAAGTTRVPKVHWLIDGVEWRRDRHSHAGQRHGFTLEITTATSTTPPAWTLMIVKEYWRGADGEDLKMIQWAQVERGNRAHVVAWLQRQEKRLEP
jgi:hypothetical protein